MKNKILLSSVTLLSALMVAACGNGEKKATETTAAPTTEATTATPTTTAQTTTAGASATTKEISLENTQRVGADHTGYINVPKDWKKNNVSKVQYYSPDKYNIVTLHSFNKDQVKLQSGETFGAELIANRTYSNIKTSKEVKDIKSSKTKFAGEDAFFIKVLFTDGKYYYCWVFQKGEIIYGVQIEGSEEMLNALKPIFDQSFGLDPKTPGK
ncbi:MAG: hypothetical protein HXO94_01080 [Streptococcus sp.]|nr:hypothetical protein [Streptococcus sp.]